MGNLNRRITKKEAVNYLKAIEGLCRDVVICPKCGKRMKNSVDLVTKKKSKHLFKCKCTPNKVLFKG